MNKVYDIEPLSYFKRTNKNKFSPTAKRYHTYLNALRWMKFDYQEGWGITFVLPMPESWSNKKRKEMNGQPMRRKRWRDCDNMLKAVFDCLPYDDGLIAYVGPLRKIYGKTGQIIVHQYGVDNYFNEVGDNND